MELTDLEICKQVAEIEGEDCKVNFQNILVRIIPLGDTGTTNNCYDPLSDDGLCFRLMLKHDIKLSRNRDKEYVAMYSHCRGADDESPNKAICLAIIEKHE